MPAYMIVLARVTDREAFMRGYAPAAARLIEQFGGRYLLRAPGASLLEGAWGEGASVVISQWPDRAAAQAFWDSPEYAQLKQMRAGQAEVQVVLVDGEISV